MPEYRTRRPGGAPVAAEPHRLGGPRSSWALTYHKFGGTYRNGTFTVALSGYAGDPTELAEALLDYWRRTDTKLTQS